MRVSRVSNATPSAQRADGGRFDERLWRSSILVASRRTMLREGQRRTDNESKKRSGFEAGFEVRGRESLLFENRSVPEASSSYERHRPRGPVARYRRHESLLKTGKLLFIATSMAMLSVGISRN